MIIIHNSYYFFLQVRPPIIHGFSIQGSCSHIIIGFVSFSSTKRSMRWREYSNISNPRLKKNELGKKYLHVCCHQHQSVVMLLLVPTMLQKAQKSAIRGKSVNTVCLKNLKSALFELANKIKQPTNNENFQICTC